MGARLCQTQPPLAKRSPVVVLLSALNRPGLAEPRVGTLRGASAFSYCCAGGHLAGGGMRHGG